MDYYINKGELYHWGIRGMKWGKRRYQNPDGSLTAEGKKRYGYDGPNYDNPYEAPRGGKAKDNKGPRYSDDYKRYHDGKKSYELSDDDLKKRTARFENEQKYRKFTGEKSRTETMNDIIDSTRRVADDSTKMIDTIDRIQKNHKKGPDLSNYSNQELRAIVERMELERRYMNNYTPQETKKGMTYVKEALAVTGGALAIGGSVVAILNGIKELRS